MTRDEVIRLAREAGTEVQATSLLVPFLERFAARVEDATREACAKEWGKTFQAAGIGFGIGAQK